MHRCGSRNIVYMNVFDAETRTLLLAFAWLAKQKWLVSFALKVATGSPCNLFVSSSNQHQGASVRPSFATIGSILMRLFIILQLLHCVHLERSNSYKHHTQQPTKLGSRHITRSSLVHNFNHIAPHRAILPRPIFSRG
jgi:hypothetical protein